MIAQATRDSEKCSKKFLLIIGQDRQEPIVLTNDYHGTQNQICLGNDYREAKNFQDIMEIRLAGIPYYILKLSDILKFSDSYFFE